MSHLFKILLVFLMMLLLSSCSSVIQEGATPAPVHESGAQVDRGDMPPPTGEAGKRYQAVVALVQQADRHEQQGQHARSAAFLERALRITPRDAWLWNKLATVRLKQGHYAQAESMARKSLSLPGVSPRLKISNWELILEAAEKQAKQGTVLRARQKLMQLRQQEE